MPRPIITITQVARHLGVSTRTIRIYEEEGLITVERAGGRCFLRPKDVEVIALTERLKQDLGVNVAGVGVILEMRNKMIELQKQIDLMERDFQERVRQALEEQRRDMQGPLERRGVRAMIKVRDEDD